MYQPVDTYQATEILAGSKHVTELGQFDADELMEYICGKYILTKDQKASLEHSIGEKYPQWDADVEVK
jgi:uncharacterized protein (DUF2164 family)